MRRADMECSVEIHEWFCHLSTHRRQDLRLEFCGRNDHFRAHLHGPNRIQRSRQ